MHSDIARIFLKKSYCLLYIKSYIIYKIYIFLVLFLFSNKKEKVKK